MKAKHVLCVVLPLVLAACLLSACASMSAMFASSPSKVVVDFTYRIGGSGEAKAVMITGYTGKGGAAEIPAVIEGFPVVAISKDAFDDCVKLTSLTIPASVIIIGDNIDKAEDAFDGATGLTSITVDEANGVFSSEDGVLFNKDKTTLLLCPEGKSGNYTIPSSVTHIADCAFELCSKLTGVTIPDSATSIGDSAFIECESLTSIAIPDSVTYIGEAAFQNCVKLTSVTVSPVNGRKWDIGEGSIVYWIFRSCPLDDASKTALVNAGYPTNQGKF